MWLFVGLGNPGKRYERTRHNLGFRAIDAIAPKGLRFKERFQGLIAETEIASQRVVLLKPLTYMNLSGMAVVPVMKEFFICPDNLLVFCDDIDLPLGRIRLRRGGSSGGHRGLQSIIDAIGEKGFYRFRLGIGRAEGVSARDYVLQEFTYEEERLVQKVLQVVKEASEVFLTEGPETTMNRYNGLVIT